MIKIEHVYRQSTITKWRHCCGHVIIVSIISSCCWCFYVAWFSKVLCTGLSVTFLLKCIAACWPDKCCHLCACTFIRSTRHCTEVKTYIIACLKCEPICKLINKTPGLCLLISSLLDSAWKNACWIAGSLHSTSIVKALPDKLDIKIRSSSKVLARKAKGDETDLQLGVWQKNLYLSNEVNKAPKFVPLESVLDKSRVTKQIFTVRTMKENPVFVQSGEYSTITWQATYLYSYRATPLFSIYYFNDAKSRFVFTVLSWLLLALVIQVTGLLFIHDILAQRNRYEDFTITSI